MHLVFCSDNEAFSKDQLRDKQWSYRFPGSGWITCLYRMGAVSGIEVTSGDVAITNIASKKWNAKDVYVIQERVSSEAGRLLDMGATPFLITCLEAPLYAPFFYDEICETAANFRFSMGFGFAEAKCGIENSVKDLPFRFPSFYLEDLREPHPWSNRKEMVLVAANKYRTNRLFLPHRPSPRNLLRQLKSLSWQIVSPAYRKSLAASLHDQRLEAIEQFAGIGALDLYGAGWDNWQMLPTFWVDRLRNIVCKQYLGKCSDKLDTISDYRFSICFENMVLPGYMTEKMVDCFVAGSIPLYLGAPDIETLVPPGAFVDMRKFDSNEQANVFLNLIDEGVALTMIQAGRDYLNTEAGMLHSYEGFARNVIRLAQSC